MPRCLGPLFLAVAAGLRPSGRRRPSLLRLSSQPPGPTYRLANTPVDSVHFRGAEVWVKRDDQLRLQENGVFGNKGRKFHWLASLAPEAFPASVASYGGPQSNAMVALAAVAHQQRAARAEAGATDGAPRFLYVTKKLPRWLRKYPSGNLARALALGMELRELDAAAYKRAVGGVGASLGRAPAALAEVLEGSTLWVPQGGAMVEAEPGLRLLAEEIRGFWEEHLARTRATDERLVVAVPAGTGTTALFLARHLAREDIRVVALSCCGSAQYLEEQIQALDRVTRASGQAATPKPAVLGGSFPVPFGQPRRDLLDLWNELTAAGLYCDLVYAPRAWQILLEHWPDGTLLSPGERLMYVHTGGLEGVSTQLTRYRRNGLLETEDEGAPVSGDTGS